MARRGSLLLVALLVVTWTASAQVCSKVCCSTHFAVANGFVDQLVSLQQDVKKESVTKFVGNYDRQKAKSFLYLAGGALKDIAAHFGTLSDASDQSAATAIAERLLAAGKEIGSAASDAEAKAKFEALNLDLKLPKAVATASVQ